MSISLKFYYDNKEPLERLYAACFADVAALHSHHEQRKHLTHIGILLNDVTVGNATQQEIKEMHHLAFNVLKFGWMLKQIGAEYEITDTEVKISTVAPLPLISLVLQTYRYLGELPFIIKTYKKLITDKGCSPKIAWYLSHVVKYLPPSRGEKERWIISATSGHSQIEGPSLTIKSFGQIKTKDILARAKEYVSCNVSTNFMGTNYIMTGRKGAWQSDGDVMRKYTFGGKEEDDFLNKLHKLAGLKRRKVKDA